MEIKRDYYLNKLIEAQDDGLIKIITGIRRCGKSYLLNNIFSNYLVNEKKIPEKQIIKLDLDRKENEKYLNSDELFKYINSKIIKNKKCYILLDEIQLVGDFVSVLNSYVDNTDIDVYVTGSNSKFLSSDVVTEFRGRGEEIRIYPLSFSEFMENYQEDKFEGWNEYITYGGLPEIVANMHTKERKMTYLDNQVKNVYINDVIERNQIGNDSQTILTLLEILSSSIGSLTNPAKISNTFQSELKYEIAPATIANYLNHLEESFIIDGAKRYDIKGRKYINTPLKFYYSDIGVRNSIIQYTQFEESHIMENVIYNELSRKGYKVSVGKLDYKGTKNNKYFYKQLEVDFIATKGNDKIYIQSALTMPDKEKREQEIRPLLLINDSFRKIVITKDYVPNFKDENGIETINLFDFLLNKNMLI